MPMFRHCSMRRRCLWLAAPLAAGHLGCLAIPAATLAAGTTMVLPICGGQGPVRYVVSLQGSTTRTLEPAK